VSERIKHINENNFVFFATLSVATLLAPPFPKVEKGGFLAPPLEKVEKGGFFAPLFFKNRG